VKEKPKMFNWTHSVHLYKKSNLYQISLSYLIYGKPRGLVVSLFRPQPTDWGLPTGSNQLRSRQSGIPNIL